MEISSFGLMAIQTIGVVIACLVTGRSLFHFFQLESYQFPGYFRTIRRQGIRVWAPGILLSVLMLAGGILLQPSIKLSNTRNTLCCILLSVWSILGGLLIHRALSRQTAKKKMVFTPRMKRLYFVSFIVFAALFILCLSLSQSLFSSHKVLALGIESLFPSLLPIWISISGLLAWPLEKTISEMYFRDAQRILKERPDLIRIGITGSWGKTSVKFVLGTLLGEKYPVLVTPASFNTPMGVTKVIRTMLEPGHRVFVAEMGARHVGDIRELCRLVHPEIGILTSVGPQHLDTFHTQERITKTKYELMEAIPEDGACFFSDDDGIVFDLWKKTKKNKYLTGLDSKKDDTWAEDISISSQGSSFVLCHGDERIACETELLGELNIRNIVLCADVCFYLGLTGREISRGIRKLKPVEHRLQLKRGSGGITVLDDAFNSNIRGAKQAFEVLKEFPHKRIIVTPGMVELGEQEEKLNQEFGQAMAGCCDIAILVGKKRSEAIMQGLDLSGFASENIIVVSSLQEAEEKLKEITVAGDTILFENDLPDNYSEE